MRHEVWRQLLGKVVHVYRLSSISMICVQNAQLNCKNSSPECTKNRYFETKNGFFFLGGGRGTGAQPLLTSHPHPTALGASTVAPTALPPAAIDYWVPPRFWKSWLTYGPVGAVLWTALKTRSLSLYLTRSGTRSR